MLVLLCLMTTTRCGAQGEAEPDTVVDSDLIHDEVIEVHAAVAEQASRMAVIEHYIADEARVKRGEAPDGWVQPPLYMYAEPGAPASMLPEPR